MHACSSPEVKRLVTDEARICLDASVTQSKVEQQFIRCSESQTALVADVRSSLKVDVLVLVKSLRLWELAAAVLAFERLLSRVVAHVGRVLRRQQEWLGAERAGIRSLVGVDALVGVEVVDAREALAASITSIGTFAGMRTNVQVQIADLGELAITCVARVGAVSSVGPHVAIEVTRPQERSLALAALVRRQKALVVTSEVNTQIAGSSERDATDVAAVAFLSRSTPALCWRFLHWLWCHYHCLVHLRNHLRCFNLHLCIHQVFIFHNFIFIVHNFICNS